MSTNYYHNSKIAYHNMITYRVEKIFCEEIAVDKLLQDFKSEKKNYWSVC
jgi:hypothetical protein